MKTPEYDLKIDIKNVIESYLDESFLISFIDFLNRKSYIFNRVNKSFFNSITGQITPQNMVNIFIMDIYPIESNIRTKKTNDVIKSYLFDIDNFKIIGSKSAYYSIDLINNQISKWKVKLKNKEFVVSSDDILDAYKQALLLLLGNDIKDFIDSVTTIENMLYHLELANYNYFCYRIE